MDPNAVFDCVPSLRFCSSPVRSCCAGTSASASPTEVVKPIDADDPTSASTASPAARRSSRVQTRTRTSCSSVQQRDRRRRSTCTATTSRSRSDSRTASVRHRLHREGDRRLRDRAAPDGDPRASRRSALLDGQVTASDLAARARDRGDSRPPGPALRLLLRRGGGAGGLVRRPGLPLAEARARRAARPGARCPQGSSACSSPPGCGSWSGRSRSAVLAFLWLGALVGKNSSGVNFTPTFVYVFFWIGMPLVVGRVRERLVGARPVAGGGGGRRAGSCAARLRDEPPFEYPERLGRWPAAVLLLSFAAMELTYAESLRPARARARDRDLQRAHLGRARSPSAPRPGSGTATASRSTSSSSRGSARSRRREDGQLVVADAVLRPLDQRPDAGDDRVRRGDARLDVLRRLQPDEHLAEPLLQRPGRPARQAEPRRPRRAADERRRDARLRRLRRARVPARGARDRVDRRAAAAVAGVRRQPDPDRARLRDRALLLAAPLPGRGRRAGCSPTRGAAAGTCSARTTSSRTSRS